MSSKLTIDDEVSAAWGRLTSDASTVSWIACGYLEGNTSVLSFLKEGTNGMPEFIASIPKEEVIWGAFKVVAVDDRGNLVSRRPKYILVKYAPPVVPTMKRAKAGGHKGAVKQIFSSHVDVEVESLDELTEEMLIAKLRACGGAHAPTSYEFSNFSVGNTTNAREGANSPTPAAVAAPAPVAPAPKPAVAPTPAPAPVVEKKVEVEEVKEVVPPAAPTVVEEVEKKIEEVAQAVVEGVEEISAALEETNVKEGEEGVEESI